VLTQNPDGPTSHLSVVLAIHGAAAVVVVRYKTHVPFGKTVFFPHPLHQARLLPSCFGRPSSF
jgi:hypothetical protein